MPDSPSRSEPGPSRVLPEPAEPSHSPQPRLRRLRPKLRRQLPRTRVRSRHCPLKDRPPWRAAGRSWKRSPLPRPSPSPPKTSPGTPLSRPAPQRRAAPFAARTPVLWARPRARHRPPLMPSPARPAMAPARPRWTCQPAAAPAAGRRRRRRRMKPTRPAPRRPAVASTPLPRVLPVCPRRRPRPLSMPPRSSTAMKPADRWWKHRAAAAPAAGRRRRRRRIKPNRLARTMPPPARLPPLVPVRHSHRWKQMSAQPAGPRHPRQLRSWPSAPERPRRAPTPKSPGSPRWTSAGKRPRGSLLRRLPSLLGSLAAGETAAAVSPCGRVNGTSARARTSLPDPISSALIMCRPIESVSLPVARKRSPFEARFPPACRCRRRRAPGDPPWPIRRCRRCRRRSRPLRPEASVPEPGRRPIRFAGGGDALRQRGRRQGTSATASRALRRSALVASRPVDAGAVTARLVFCALGRGTSGAGAGAGGIPSGRHRTCRWLRIRPAQGRGVFGRGRRSLPQGQRRSPALAARLPIPGLRQRDDPARTVRLVDHRQEVVGAPLLRHVDDRGLARDAGGAVRQLLNEPQRVLTDRERCLRHQDEVAVRGRMIASDHAAVVVELDLSVRRRPTGDHGRSVRLDADDLVGGRLPPGRRKNRSSRHRLDAAVARALAGRPGRGRPLQLCDLILPARLRPRTARLVTGTCRRQVRGGSTPCLLLRLPGETSGPDVAEPEPDGAASETPAAATAQPPVRLRWLRLSRRTAWRQRSFRQCPESHPGRSRPSGRAQYRHRRPQAASTHRRQSLRHRRPAVSPVPPVPPRTARPSRRRQRSDRHPRGFRLAKPPDCPLSCRCARQSRRDPTGRRTRMRRRKPALDAPSAACSAEGTGTIPPLFEPIIGAA